MQHWKIKILNYFWQILPYQWHALAAAWVLCVIGWGVVSALPDQYRAEAKVYIDTDNLMDPLLKGLTVKIDPAQEIAVMLKALITRPTLEQVVNLTDPRAKSLSTAQMQERVLQLQNAISIRELEAKNYYAIGFNNRNADYATSVTQTLLSILQDNRVGTTRINMDGARSFINKQIDDYEQRLRDADKRRADFRTANIDILGKGPAANRIDTADSALQQAVRDLDAAIARRDSLRRQMTETPKTIPMDERMFPSAGSPSVEGLGRAENSSQRLVRAQAQLEQLLSKYTENYPDVISTRDLIARIQAQMASGQSDLNGSSIMVTNPDYSQLLDKLSNEETNIAALRRRVAADQADLAKAKKDAAVAIDIMAEFNSFDRDYGNIEATYKELLQSRESASLSQARDDQNQGISFRVLEPPQKPEFPTFPNRLIFNSAVLFLGLIGGVGFAAALSLGSGYVLSSDDLANHFDFPIFGVVTEVPGHIGLRHRVSALGLSMSLGLLLVSYLGVIALLRTSVFSLLGV